ncbi:hypothetical protein IWW36_005880, partial [Coemansia brasiliensis]
SIPHIPKLLLSLATLQHASNKLQGNLLLIDSASDSIFCAIERKLLSALKIIDLLAGYLHKTTAASSGHKGRAVLHQ